MSNQTGDRYTCSDPNCGCEIEVKSPCNILGNQRNTSRNSSTHVDEASNSSSALPESARTSEVAPPVGSVTSIRTSGTAETTGEGIFGTSGGNDSPTRQGRYGSDIRKAVSPNASSLRSAGSNSNRAANSSLDPEDNLSGAGDMDTTDVLDTVNDFGNSTRSRSVSMSLTCFCGSQMTQAQPRSMAARVG